MRSNWMRRILQADQRPKQNHKDENLPALPQEQYLLGKGTWTDVEPGEYSISDYEVSKKLILLRHARKQREDDGAIEFCIVLIGVTTGGRKAWQKEEATRKDISTVLILQE